MTHNIIPLRSNGKVVPRQRAGALLFAHGRYSAAPTVETANTPEPVQLYGLVVLALVLHNPSNRSGLCMRCGVAWPCAQVSLAFRLREGF